MDAQEHYPLGLPEDTVFAASEAWVCKIKNKQKDWCELQQNLFPKSNLSNFDRKSNILMQCGHDIKI
ncbi:MAG: hypothetical protein HYT37_00920 [Candidatus Sungbacteria bacterium]|nr:hypothetical protein [Candidatus Sungbacteria bacterium]